VTFDEFKTGKYKDRTMNMCDPKSSRIIISRWYPIGGDLDGPCWNLARRTNGGLSVQQIYSVEPPEAWVDLED